MEPTLRCYAHSHAAGYSAEHLPRQLAYSTPFSFVAGIQLVDSESPTVCSGTEIYILNLHAQSLLTPPSGLQRSSRPNRPSSAALGTTFDTLDLRTFWQQSAGPGPWCNFGCSHQPWYLHHYPGACSFGSHRVRVLASVHHILEQHSSWFRFCLAFPQGSNFPGNEAVTACHLFKRTTVSFQHTAPLHVLTLPRASDITEVHPRIQAIIRNLTIPPTIYVLCPDIGRTEFSSLSWPVSP